MGLFSRFRKKPAVSIAPAVEEKAEEAVEELEEAVEEAAEELAEEVAEAAAALAEEPVEEPAPEPEPTCKELGKVYKVSMNYHAGHDQYSEWPTGGVTIHAGVGWFHPFGPSRYWAVQDMGQGYPPEADKFPVEDFFTEDWMKQFETDLFCVYRMEDGDIYAWDGIFAVRGLDPNECVRYNSSVTRQDALVNVIVGGTGRYEGARGLMIGTAEGGGEGKVVAELPGGAPLELPATIIKHLEGFIRIPEPGEEPAEETPDEPEEPAAEEPAEAPAEREEEPEAPAAEEA